MTNTSAAESIERIIERVSEGGNLLANLALIEIDTWQTSEEVWKAWQSGAKPGGVSTANMGIYRLVEGEPVFDLLGKQGNLFMDDRFREDTYNEILQNDFFFLPEAMKSYVMDAIAANASVTVRYSGLDLKTKDCDENYCFIEASDKNTDEENKLFNGVYGVENPGNGKKIFLLRSNIVKKQLKDKPNELIVRACCFGNGNYFDALDGGISLYLSAVRGVRRVDVAEGDAKKVGIIPDEIVEPDYKLALDTLLGNPDKVLSLLNANPTARLSLLNVVTNSYNATK